MKRLYTILFFLIVACSVADAQNFNNSWINFNPSQPYSIQPYFRISVWKDGIYRLTYSDLANAQFPVDSNPQRLQLFHHGREQYIYVNGEQDGIFDPTDYIEFYGQKNDGSLDVSLYASPSDQVNPYYSLFNDTAAYYLSINFSSTIVNKRMVIENDNNFNAYVVNDYVLKEVASDSHSSYFAGNAGGAVNPFYSRGEGFTDPLAGGSAGPVYITKNLSTPNVFTGTAPAANVKAGFMNANNDGYSHEIKVELNNNTTYIDIQNIYGYNFYDQNFNINSINEISGGTASLRFIQTLMNTGPTATNYFSSSYASIKYPHTLNYSGENSAWQQWYLDNAQLQAKARLDITNFNTSDNSTRYIYVFSGDTIKRVSVFVNGNTAQALIPFYGITSKCMLTMESATFSAGGNVLINPVTTDPSRFALFLNYTYNQPAYDYFIVTCKSFWNEAGAFRNHRAASGYSPLLLDIDELYDQFAFGIRKHPESIRNFCAFANTNFSPAQKYLFLIGKAVYPEYVRLFGGSYNQDLVPTFGNPPADNMFTVGINPSDTLLHPIFATGRLAAQNASEVAGYLDKIVAQELAQAQPQPQDWMKHVLHFGGGEGEQDLIRIYLDRYKAIIEDTLFGGIVSSFFKTSSDPIEYLNSLSLQARIDSGVSIMTFFGHAAGSSFDLSTDIPQNYKNKDRYPIVIANSCLVGDIYNNPRQLNEDFVLLPEQGAIGFIALPNQGYLYDLGEYTTYLYRQIGIYDYGEPIGHSMRGAIDSMMNYYYLYSNTDFRNTALSMGLHGDPALKINPRPKPEYIISQPSIYFTETGNPLNNNITTEMTTFDLNVVVTNLGKMISDSVHIEVTRKFPGGGTDYFIDRTVPRIHYKDTIVFTLNMDPSRAAGMNFFDIIVDRTNIIPEEYDEIYNNRVFQLPLMIQSNDINPVYPFKYAIIANNNNVTLKATTSDPFAPSHTYVFELDTNDSFSSPFYKKDTITQGGGIVRWNLPFSPDSGVTYFWRTARNEIYTNPALYRWNESSFVYIPTKTGWGQQHFHQFKNDKYNNIIYNKPQREFDFSNVSALAIAHNTSIGGNAQDVTLNGSLIADKACPYFQNQIVITVFDSVTLESWENRIDYGQLNVYKWDSLAQDSISTCSGHHHAEGQFNFYTDFSLHPESVDSLISFLGKIPCNNYIFAYNILGAKFNTWSVAQRTAFANAFGINQNSIDTMVGSEPYIFFAQKCHTSTVQQVWATQGQTDISLTAVIGGNWYKGFITSEIIGPAVNWTSLHWASHPYEPTPGADSIDLSLIAVDTLGQETTIISNLPSSISDFQLTGISATTYPYMYFKGYVEDAILRTPPQLDRWQIYYDPVPECAVVSNGFVFYKDTLMEGDSVHISIPVENISTANMDSLLVDFYFYDNNRVRHNISSPRYQPLLSGQTIMASAKIATFNYVGNNSLWVEANPRNDQREQYHYNNFANLDFHVNRDITNPILDVTFDGIHILNGDLVSAKPYIMIRLKDENKFMELRDTSKYTVRVKSPSGKLTKIGFESSPNIVTTNELMGWNPADLPDNTFRIEYKPIFPEDGIYELQVNGRDESGNISGQFDYKIQFEVINKSSITNVLNYPNPFTTSTRFVFTLTGSEAPSYLKIQIMTVTGKIVREITQPEIGNVHVGRNITDYAWDGKDQFGDQLAKGVYLYRVYSQINGSDIEHRDTDADHFFVKGFGKMYLLK